MQTYAGKEMVTDFSNKFRREITLPDATAANFRIPGIFTRDQDTIIEVRDGNKS
jgi:hypothetical protein